MFKLGPLVYFLILFSSVPSKDIIIDYSDVVEVNYVYRYDDTAEKYNKRMCQIIWWEFRNIFQQDKDGNYRHLPQYVVKDFRVVWSETSSPKKVGSIMPIRRGKDWVCLFYDKNDNRVREVVSYSKTESHTQHDPEVDNRKVLPLNMRNKLSK